MRVKRVIIIGAGIAGLAACARLREHGFDAFILEARNRYGGRICTDQSLGVPLGRGANFIHGVDNNPITNLANTFHAELAPTRNHFFRYDRNGHLISDIELESFNKKMDTLIQQSKMQTTSDKSLAESLSALIKLDTFSAQEADLFQLKLRYFEGYIGADYHALSTKYWDQEEIWPGENCFAANSYQPILDGLAKNCPIKLNTVVTKIKKRTNDVEIETNHTTFYADAVVVTIPLGVLQRDTIMFDPPLPQNKQQAISNLGMGLLDIAAFRFPTMFWPAEAQALCFTQFDELSIPIFFNLYPITNTPILLGFYGGERASQIEALSDNQIVNKTMENFRNLYGKNIPDPESYFITRWYRDPFSYGSYSFFKVGSSKLDYESLATPVEDWLFFAGEATSAQYLATTHGAYLSGIREADRIQNLEIARNK